MGAGGAAKKKAGGFLRKKAGSVASRAVGATPSAAARASAAALPPNDAVASKRARGRWAKLRTALMAKNLFATKESAADVYGVPRVRTRGERTAAPTEALAALEAKVRATGGKWTDPDFPPNDTSLHGSGPPLPGPQVVAWKRLSELVPSPQLFKDGVEAGDVMQGKNGNCWQLGPLSVIAEREQLFMKMFLSTKVSDVGVYGFRFFRDGKWVDVFVDDWVPVTHGDKLVFAHGPDPEEIWVPLIEKAMAKFYSSYASCKSGTESAAFLDMTGSFPVEADVKKDFPSPKEVWTHIQQALQQGDLVGCSGKGKTIEEVRRGLLMMHAYGILAVGDTGSARLIKLRNPWGKGEWEGKWADADAAWTPALRKKFNVVDADDGIFYMEDVDFVKYFDTLFVCRIVPDTWSREMATDAWSRAGNTAGGCTSYPFWRFNPQWTLEVPAGGADVSFLLTQASRRHLNNEYPQIGLYIFQTKTGNLKKLDAPKKDMVHGNEFLGAREMTIETPKLGEGTYAVMPSTYNPGVEASFTITAFSERPVTLRRAQDWLKIAVNGAWSGATAGGCSNAPSWSNNPQFAFALKAPGKVIVNLAPRNTKKKPHIGFLVFSGDSRVTSAFGAIHTASFIDADVAAELDLGAGRYTVVPSTFDPGEQYEFTLTLYSSVPAALGPLGQVDLSAFSAAAPPPPPASTGAPAPTAGPTAAPTSGGGGASTAAIQLAKDANAVNNSVDGISSVIQHLRGLVKEAAAVPSLVPLAKGLAEVRPTFEAARTLLPGVVPRGAAKDKTGDKLRDLKAAVTFTIGESMHVLIAARTYSADATADGAKMNQLKQLMDTVHLQLKRLASSL